MVYRPPKMIWRIFKMKNTNKSLRRITATLVAMAASASFAAAPISGAGITFSMPSFSASAADTDVLTYKDFSYKVTENGIVITAYNGSEAKPVIPSAIDETAVTAIGNSAFYKCTTLTEIEIPASVTNIGINAFKDCTSLEKLTLNEGLTTLSQECFANTKITSVTIPSTLSSVSMDLEYYYGGPFGGCDSLNNVTFNDKTTTIHDNLFKECSGLKTITIPDTITSIGNSAFLSCSNLTEIEIPASVTNIGINAFKDCTSLEKLTLNEGLTTLSQECFANTKITSVTIPSTLSSVSMDLEYYYGGPFGGCDSLNNVTFNDKTTTIHDNLFKECSGLKTITIPDTITSIGNSAFLSCSNLTEIEIPASVTNIGINAFKDCTSLEKLTLNEGLTTLSQECFANTKITSVTIPSTLSSVSMDLEYYYGGPFGGCDSLNNVTFNDKTTTIHDNLFKECSGLKTITIPDTITSIGNSAFLSCSNLTEIEIPASVTNIGINAFKDCTSLEKLTLNEGLTTLSQECFANTKITSVTIPSTLSSVNMDLEYYYGGPFGGCKLLEDITIDEKATKIPDYLFKNCSSLATIDIPYFVRNIGKSAFEDCTSLKDVTIHNPYCDINNKNNTISNSATIHSYTPSTAKNYAQSFEREFVSLGSFTLGDVNEDGSINSSDASKVLEEYALIQTGAEPTFTEIQKISADVNKDYTIDSSDASKILAYYADSSTGKTPSWD